jgi:hypothetical protein
MRQALWVLRLLCGWFVLYIAVGGLLSFAFDGPETPGLGCVPYGGEPGVIVIKCASAAATLFWEAVVGWPRLVIVFPALQVAMVHAAARNPHFYWAFLYDATGFSVLSVPLAFAVWGSFSHWKTRSKVFAIALTAMLLAEIAYLGLTM